MYKNQISLATDYGYHPSTISRMVAEMKGSGRYPANAIIGERKRRRVLVEAFEDYLVNMEMLKHPNMKKYVKPYKK